jgi:hypothetical protein
VPGDRRGRHRTSVTTMRHPSWGGALLVRGTVLRIADLRSQPANIRVADSRLTLSGHMVELSSDLHLEPRGDVAAVP